MIRNRGAQRRVNANREAAGQNRAPGRGKGSGEVKGPGPQANAKKFMTGAKLPVGRRSSSYITIAVGASFLARKVMHIVAMSF